ncbi:MAG: hypothetical protein GF388_08550, partial [Candidatus Aegiribacteria sp.]|nr:hypothetical protein [Candidatus Aegiribacteria sp.]
MKPDVQGAFDGSTKGIALRQSPKVRKRAKDAGFIMAGGSIDLARNPDLDSLQSFTIEATIKPKAIGGKRQNIIEGQTPAVAFFIDSGGKLVGSVHTASGWGSVNSGSTLIKAGADSRVVFTRDSNGKMELRINGRATGSKAVQGSIQNVGAEGLKIGTWIDGKRYAFKGNLSDVQIRQGTVSQQFYASKETAAKRIEQAFKAKTGLSRVVVNLMPDYGNSRLQPIKDIMNAVGVQKLSDLDTLQITTPTVMVPGTVLVAPRKSSGGDNNWADLVKDFRKGGIKSKHDLVGRFLPNRNSAELLKKIPEVSTPVASSLTRGRFITPGGRISGLGRSLTTGTRVPLAILRDNPSLRLASETVRLHDLFEGTGSSVRVRNKEFIKDLDTSNPALWVGTTSPGHRTYSLTTIPVDSAVIIGSTIDLTDTELKIEPSVSTLYLIADKLICGNNASITWRRPGGETPPRLSNPDLNGSYWSGVHTKPNSRDGLDGGDGHPGAPGISGAAGLSAPKLEIWVKDMSAVPNLDLNGEDGRKGGQGQGGGHGGRGADGQLGRRTWFFGWHCTTDPGDGGDGGDGGNGGRGGDGGSGGNGGKGGRSGAGETCHDASAGHNGAKGQPGPTGNDGSNPGIDAEIGFLEFTLDEWDALLTRPWISEAEPTYAFPGDSLTIRGSRFSAGDRVKIAGFTLAPTINADESISVTVPLNISGGITSIYVRRQDGTESNRLNIWIKPQLDAFSATLMPGATVTLTGRAFVSGASVLIDGEAAPADVADPNQLSFSMPGTGGGGGGGNTVALQVRNPDGLVSNTRSASVPRI